VNIAADGDREVDIEICSFIKEEIFGQSKDTGYVNLINECVRYPRRLCAQVVPEQLDIPIGF
jgi:hypothetical protein